MAIGIMHFILPPDGRRLAQRLLDPLPSGGYRAMAIGISDFAVRGTRAALARPRRVP